MRKKTRMLKICLVLLAGFFVVTVDAKSKKTLIPRVYDHVGRVTYVMHIPTTTYSLDGISGSCDISETRVDCSSASPATFHVILEEGAAEYTPLPIERPLIDPISDFKNELISNGDKSGDRRLFQYRVMQLNEKAYRLTRGQGGYCIRDDRGQAAEACYRFAK